MMSLRPVLIAAVTAFVTGVASIAYAPLGDVAQASPPATPSPATHPSSSHGFSCDGAMADMPSVPSDEGMVMPGSSACVAYRPALSADGWSIAASSAAPGHPAASALGSADGYWQSAPASGRFRTQTVTLRTRTAVGTTGLQYVPQSHRASIGRFDVRLSSDGRHFGAPVAGGRWEDNPTSKQVGWNPTEVRAVRITVRSTSPRRSSTVAAASFVLTGVQAEPGQTDPMTAPRVARAAAAGPSVVGKWGSTIAFPLIPVAVAVLPDNRLVVWSADENLNWGSTAATQTAIVDLSTGAVSATRVSSTNHNMFCPGVSILPDGRILVTGGVSNAQTSIFDPKTSQWSAGPAMNIGRGYQGQTTLSDGQAFTVGGSWSGGSGGKLGEVWSPSGAWRGLTSVTTDPLLTADPQGIFRSDNHMWLVATSGGNVLQAGPSKQMHWISTTGAGSTTSAGSRGTADDQMNGNAVLFDVNKILTVGGATAYQDVDATTTANVVTTTGRYGSVPTVTQTGSLTFARAFANSAVLPDGSVFTTGGQSHPVPFSDDTATLTPELWKPSTGRWTSMAPEAEPRTYHSVANLLPDGSVFSGGGGLCGGCATNHPTAQIFYPPYLFNADGSRATRPTIANVPATSVAGKDLVVTSKATSFVLVRAGESTHSIDNDQRRVPLSVKKRSGSTVTLSVPSDTGVVLPGPYLLFAMSSAGVPSIAASVTISAPAPAAGSTYEQAVAATSPALQWSLADAAGSTTAADRTQNRTPGGYSSSGVTYGAPSPVQGASGQGVSLDGGSVVSSQPQLSQPAFSSGVWFKTATARGALMTFGDSANGQHNGSQDRMVYLNPQGQLSFGVYDGATRVVTSSLSYADDAWHHAVASQDGSGMRLYIDGNLVASGSTATTISYPAYFQLGVSVNNDGWPGYTAGAFKGTLSDAAMWMYALSPTQVTKIYTASGVPR